MGSCDREIDVSAGTLVWVRRRNGHWWPARVVVPDELPASCAKLRKVGTPIKLLGSEDGSMDWYNLEKSKRVKAFRCGEYDDIIEKAKDSALRANRRSINERKYVRREDAILHALELEKACYFDGNHKVDSVVSNSMITSDKIFGLQSTRPSKKAVYPVRAPSSFERSIQELSQSVVSFEHLDEHTASGMHLMQRKRRRTPNESEDDASEGMKRMRDLEDLQRKESSNLDIPHDVSLTESDSGNDFSGVSPVNSSKDSTSSFKRKESQVQACGNTKYKSFRSLVGSTNEGRSNSICYRGDIGLKIEVRGQKSTLEKPGVPSVIDGSPDSSGTSCEENLFHTNECKYDLATGHSVFLSEMKDHQYPSKLQPFGNGVSDGCIGVPVIAVESASGLPKKIGTGPSDWYSKGKRNLKHPSPSLVNRSGTSDESPISDSTGQLRKSVLLSEVGDEDVLYDVELNVQTSYRTNRVPLVSLVSKSTGQAIIGHPVTVEVKKSKNRGKKSGFSPRKIRRLSSFAFDRKKEDRKGSVVEKIGGGPVVSCIPLRLVFSRLNEALSRVNSRH